MKIGNILTELRKKKGYTQEQVAEELYMNRTAYAKWESNKVMLNLSQLEKLSNLYSIKASVIVIMLETGVNSSD